MTPTKHMPMGWQTMESAPRDGTAILGWGEFHLNFCSATTMRWFTYNGGFAFRELDGEALEPTHWRPLIPPGQEPPQDLHAENAKLRQERYQILLAVFGGEDAPGYADSLGLEDVKDAMRSRQQAFNHLLDENAKLREANDKLKAFANYIIDEAFEGHDLYGDDAQKHAVKYSLLVETTFDPDKHDDPNGYAERGDQWFVKSSTLAATKGET